MWYTSCTINQAAKDRWIAANPTKAAQYTAAPNTSTSPSTCAKKDTGNALKKRDANEMTGSNKAEGKKAKKSKAIKA